MAVQKNPYLEWENQRENSDYRSRETQSSSLTRQMMKQDEYLRVTNRVNPGPRRNTRANNVPPQDPNYTCNEDIWGWQSWTEREVYVTDSDVSNNLLELDEDDSNIPGC